MPPSSTGLIRRIRSASAAILLLYGSGSTCLAQAPGASAQNEPGVYRSAGVEVRVTPLQPGVSDAEKIEALESALRELRGQRPGARFGEVTPVAVLPAPSRDAIEGVAQFVPDEKVATPSAGPATASTSSDSSWDSSWFHGSTLSVLPPTLLWQTIMANAQQPRMGFEMTSLQNSTTKKTIDTAIGGEHGLVRLTDAADGLQIQQDVFAVVLSRFSNDRDFTAADFRFGFPLTFAYDDWHAKIGYEHDSTHLGDDFIKLSGQQRQGHIREELVLGLDHLFWNKLRIYGQFGYAFAITTPTDSPPERFGWGVEWSNYVTTGPCGQPFAAFDMELRADQNYTADTTLQVGWQWKNMENGSSLRTGIECYTGKSPYGQFYRTYESWVGVGMWFDF